MFLCMLLRCEQGKSIMPSIQESELEHISENWHVWALIIYILYILTVFQALT